MRGADVIAIQLKEQDLRDLLGGTGEFDDSELSGQIAATLPAGGGWEDTVLILRIEKARP